MTKVTNIHCQGAINKIPCPMEGAKIGTIMKTIMAIDMTRPISTPTKRSRTNAMATTRGAPAPNPCMNRDAIMISKLVDAAATRLAAANSNKPKLSTGLRPKLSLSGPYRNCEAPSPNR